MNLFFKNLITKLTSDQYLTVVIKVIILCFLDVVFRFSYQYLGWLSYIVRLIGFVFLGQLHNFSAGRLKLVFKLIAGTSLTLFAWHLMSVFQKYEQTQSHFPVTAFLIYVHVEFVIGLSISYAWETNTLFRFIIHIYFFFVGGTVLQIAPEATFNLIMMTTIFVLTITTLHVFEYLEFYAGQVDDLMKNSEFKKTTYVERLQSILRKTGHEYQIYFTIITVVILSYYLTFIDIRGYKWVFLSTIGACCSNLVSVKGFFVTFSSFSVLIMKIYSVVIKGWSALEQHYGLPSDYSMVVFVVTADTFFYDMPPLERGDFVVNRLWLLLALVVETCLSLLQAISAEQESIQSTLCASIRMITIFILSIFLSTYEAYGLYLLYPMDDLAIFLTTASFVTISIRTVTSFLIFLLYKFDSISIQFRENFDDILFYTRMALGGIIFCIHFGTACFGVWTLFYGYYTKLDILRLFGLCHINIYNQFKIWRNILNHRKTILQFTANLPDASKDDILNNDDVCSICYQDMRHAKVTPCSHLFHEICLRKWLGTKNACPFCNSTIVKKIPKREITVQSVTI